MSSILLMNNGYPTKTNPSYSSYIRSIKEGLTAAGHDVSLLVLNSDFTDKKGHIRQYFNYYIQIWKANFKKYDYVLLNHYGHFAFPLLSKLSSIKQPVVHWHGEDLYPKNQMVDKLFARLAKGLPKHTMHIVPSAYYKEQLMEKLNFPANLIAVSPSGGVDTDIFKPEGGIARPTDKIRLGFASGLALEKGIELVIQLLENAGKMEATVNKKIELNYIYYGKQKVKYDELLKRYPNVVSWQAMPSDNMPQFFRSIDILLFPTYRKQESLGLVALEAMSCGVPVLAPNAYAPKEYVKSGVTGEVFETNNYADFAARLEHMINNISHYNDTRKLIIENYSKESVVDFYKKEFI